MLRLLPSEHLTQNELDAASLIRLGIVNAQQQRRIEWPATTVVARAYLDQLTRSQALPSDTTEALTAALDRADQASAGDARTSDQLDELAVGLEGVVLESARDQVRLQSLAEILEAVADRLR